MKLYNINDTHLGAIRTGGTTPRTAWELRKWLLIRFRNLLQVTSDGDLIINGDLFDTFMVALMDLLECYYALRDWLRSGHKLYLVPGNHDLSKTAATMSSFQFLCSLLRGELNVEVCSGPMTISDQCYVIPHMQNQDLFDMALGQVPKGVKHLFLHCNYDNKFAMESDHSLNLSPEQARKLPVDTIILAHEHQRSEHLAGKVLVVGNQIPSSVADCLGNDAKYMLCITDHKIEWLPVWDRKGAFQRLDWREALTGADPAAQFIRVEGDANTVEATAVPGIISKLRSAHNAFVISNAVTIEGRSVDGERISLEQVQSYNVLDALMKRLNPEQAVVVRKLLEDSNAQAS